MTVHRVAIRPVPNTKLAENKDDAQAFREKVILPALDAGEDVEVDFGAIEFATQSYVHALLSDAIRKHGEAIFEHLTFSRCSDEVKRVVIAVSEYTLAATHVAYGPAESD